MRLLWGIVREVTGRPEVPLAERCRDGDEWVGDDSAVRTVLDCESRAAWDVTAAHVDAPTVTLTWPLCGTHLAYLMASKKVLVVDVRWLGGEDE